MLADLAMTCLIAVMVQAGCAGPTRKDAVPKTLTTRVALPGLADVRYRAGIDRDAHTAYDDKLRNFYTTVSPVDILRTRSVWSVITKSA